MSRPQAKHISAVTITISIIIAHKVKGSNIEESNKINKNSIKYK